MKLNAAPVVADAKAALTALSAALEGYKSGWGGEIAEAKNRLAEELRRLDGLTFTGEAYKPEINDRNADSAKKFAKDLNALADPDGSAGRAETAYRKGRGGHRLVRAATPAACSACGGPKPPTPTTWKRQPCMGYEISGALGVKKALGTVMYTPWWATAAS
jgi:3D-(3,5/4)-trihydroxycyclohexane-1,2-dione acylhydrolase (decyclizing)